MVLQSMAHEYGLAGYEHAAVISEDSCEHSGIITGAEGASADSSACNCLQKCDRTIVYIKGIPKIEDLTNTFGSSIFLSKTKYTVYYVTSFFQPPRQT
ncbi:MAG: hypothetical protein V3W26_00460 [Thermodesulfobacteriota bacterium]